MHDMRLEKPVKKGYYVSLSPNDLRRIYHPWKYSVIIKLLGKRILIHYLKRKVQDMWKISENFTLIDLGADYYIVKLSKEDSFGKSFTTRSFIY